MITYKNLRLTIDAESVNIYFDNGYDKEPTHVVFWHIDEFEEDSEVCFSAINAVHLYYTDQKELLTRLGFEIKKIIK